MMDNGVITNNYDGYDDGYMEQEEEWEREGLLDPAWEKQQKKVSSPTHLCWQAGHQRIAKKTKTHHPRAWK